MDFNVCIWGKIPRLKAKTLVCNLWRVAQMTQPIFFHMLSESVCITSVGFSRYSTLRLPAEGSLVVFSSYNLTFRIIYEYEKIISNE